MGTLCFATLHTASILFVSSLMHPWIAICGLYYHQSCYVNFLCFYSNWIHSNPLNFSSCFHSRNNYCQLDPAKIGEYLPGRVWSKGYLLIYFSQELSLWYLNSWWMPVVYLIYSQESKMGSLCCRKQSNFNIILLHWQMERYRAKKKKKEWYSNWMLQYQRCWSNSFHIVIIML